MFSEKRKALTPFAKLAILLYAAALVSGICVVICAIFPYDILLNVLYYFCRLLSLFIEAAGIGGAIFYLSERKAKTGTRFLLTATGASGLTLLIAAVCEAFVYVEYDFVGALGAYIGAAILNYLIVLLLDLSILFFVWIIFFRRQEISPSVYKPCGIAVMVILTVYQLFSMVPDTVSFISDYYPNIYPVEIFSIVLDYVFLLASSFLGYMMIRVTQLYLTEAEATE